MTLERACEILNRERHRNVSGWHVTDHTDAVRYVAADDGFEFEWLWELEAIATAEKYERMAAEKTIAELRRQLGWVVDCIPLGTCPLGEAARAVPANKAIHFAAE